MVVVILFLLLLPSPSPSSRLPPLLLPLPFFGAGVAVGAAAVVLLAAAVSASVVGFCFRSCCWHNYMSQVGVDDVRMPSCRTPSPWCSHPAPCLASCIAHFVITVSSLISLPPASDLSSHLISVCLLVCVTSPAHFVSTISPPASPFPESLLESPGSNLRRVVSRVFSPVSRFPSPVSCIVTRLVSCVSSAVSFEKVLTKVPKDLNAKTILRLLDLRLFRRCLTPGRWPNSPKHAGKFGGSPAWGCRAAEGSLEGLFCKGKNEKENDTLNSSKA